MGIAEEFKAELSKLIQHARANSSSLSDNAKAAFAQFLKNATVKLRELEQAESQQEQAAEPSNIPDTARLLWVAAGGNPDAFINFLQTYPDPSLESIRRNPGQLDFIIRQLSKEIPGGAPLASSGGIPQSWLPSSNVWGFKYDPNSKKMFVKFNGKDVKSSGPTYVYEGVPKEIARIVETGGMPAKTTGSNKHGSWWKTKSPSIGSSVNALLVQGGFQYSRLQ